jgi:hypothetical protein
MVPGSPVQGVEENFWLKKRTQMDSEGQDVSSHPSSVQ